MNTSKRLVLALFVAFGMSALFTYSLSRHVTKVAASEHARMQPYQSPRREIAAGEVLHAGDLVTIYWPTSKPVDGAIAKVDDALNRVALYPLAVGEPILDRDLAIAGSGTGLASKIPTGMRAIALKSDEVVGVAGFLNPGSYVDVLVTTKASFGTDPVTATVLQDAEVIATGQQTEPDPSGKPTTNTVVTLLLDPQQAERALLASNQGSLHFALRNGADKNVARSTPATMSEIAPQLASKNLKGAAAPLPPMMFAQPAMAASHADAVVNMGKPVHRAETKPNTGSQMEVVYGSGKASSGMSMGASSTGSGSGVSVSKEESVATAAEIAAGGRQ